MECSNDVPARDGKSIFLEQVLYRKEKWPLEIETDVYQGCFKDSCISRRNFEIW